MSKKQIKKIVNKINKTIGLEDLKTRAFVQGRMKGWDSVEAKRARKVYYDAGGVQKLINPDEVIKPKDTTPEQEDERVLFRTKMGSIVEGIITDRTLDGKHIKINDEWKDVEEVEIINTLGAAK